MNLSNTRQLFTNPFNTIKRTRVRSGSVYGFIIILAMVAFEAFNYGTTAYALRDLLGDLRFAGFQWATLMALAFCGIDFAGIARLINQKGREDNRRESWYLFGAWLIAGTFNAALTWWGVSIAISSHATASASIISSRALTTVVPLFVAVLVWVIRILIIGSLTSALERIAPASVASRTEKTPLTLHRTSAPSAAARSAVEYTRQMPSSRPNSSVAAHPQQSAAYRSFQSRSNQK